VRVEIKIKRKRKEKDGGVPPPGGQRAAAGAMCGRRGYLIELKNAALSSS
jgi:hypothetical protein